MAINVSPLLPPEQVAAVEEAFRVGESMERSQAMLASLPRAVCIHMLRFLLLQGLSDKALEHVLAIWRAMLPPPPELDSKDLREALWRQSAWWDAFGPRTPDELTRMDRLEDLLNQTGCVEAGLDYFYWVAEHPPFNHMDDIWDEHRRGAIIALGRYGYGHYPPTCEESLARHLDDWINVQTDALDILIAMKSRLLARVAPWYIEHDPDLRPFLLPYFGQG